MSEVQPKTKKPSCSLLRKKEIELYVRQQKTTIVLKEESSEKKFNIGRGVIEYLDAFLQELCKQPALAMVTFPEEGFVKVKSAYFKKEFTGTYPPHVRKALQNNSQFVASTVISAALDDIREEGKRSTLMVRDISVACSVLKTVFEKTGPEAVAPPRAPSKKRKKPEPSEPSESSESGESVTVANEDDLFGSDEDEPEEPPVKKVRKKED